MTPVPHEYSTALSPEEKQALLEEGLVGIEKLGKCKVSIGLLDLPSPSSPSTTPSPSSSSSSYGMPAVRLRESGPSTSFIELPTDIETPAALEHIGLTRAAAEKVLERFARRPDPRQCPDTAIDYVIGDLGRLRAQPWLQEIPPREAMYMLGISVELQDALLNPRFNQLFESESLYYWLRDTMRMRYKTLEQLLGRLKDRASRIVETRKGEVKSEVPGVTRQGKLPFSSSQRPLPNTATLTNASTTPEEHGLPSVWVTVEAGPPVPEGYVALYKGTSPNEMNDLQFIGKDGLIDMDAIKTRAGRDFNGRSGAWYWTEQQKTAEEYRQWAASRSPWSETWLIRVLVPQSYLRSLRRKQLFFGREWKEYVWQCKRRYTSGDFDKLWSATKPEIIEGHICGSGGTTILKSKKEDVNEIISANHCLVIGGKKATQLVLMQRETVARFGEIVRHRVYIDVHGALTRDRSAP